MWELPGSFCFVFSDTISHSNRSTYTNTHTHIASRALHEQLIGSFKRFSTSNRRILIFSLTLIRSQTNSQGTSLIARLMGAVRNSNTRASHASVEAANHGGENGSGDGATGGAGAGGGSGTKALDSPMQSEAPDRRSSFSYLRRASERRRRRIRNQAIDAEERSTGWRTHRGSESGPDSDAVRDDQVQTTGGGYHHGVQRLTRTEPVYDEEGELADMEGPEQVGDLDDTAMDDYGSSQGHKGVPAQGKHQQQGRQPLSAEEQRRQSINDRLTEAVTDVIEFVREESFKRGKRHSLIRRRQAGGGYSAGSGASTSGGGSASHGIPGAGVAGDHELDSGEGALMGSERSSYQRRRTMRRSPRRSAQTKVYNDSDTGSAASLAHEQQPPPPPQMQAGMFDGTHRAPQSQKQEYQMSTGFEPQHSAPDQQSRRYRLQQHGSMQDSRHMYSGAGGGSYGEGTSLLLDQHRRHQSADARGPLESYQVQDLYGLGAGGGGYNLTGETYIGDENVPPEQHVRPPLAVGASPPPLPIGSTDAELMAARRRREEELDIANEGEEMAIHLDTSSETGNITGGQSKLGERHSPVRFIAPKVAPLASPSATPVPDEKIVPPDVPYRGRRLPQIPGIIRSATGLLQSTLGARHSSMDTRGVGGSLAAASVAVGAAAVPPVMKPGHYVTYRQEELDEDLEEHMFPTVSSSPTVKVDPTQQVTVPPPASIGIVKKPALESGVSLDGGSINFPRVSFSPTHSSQSTATKYGHQMGPSGRVAAIGSSAGASMIATQASGGTQSSVFGPTTSDSLISDRVSLARTRRSKRDEEDNWF